MSLHALMFPEGHLARNMRGEWVSDCAQSMGARADAVEEFVRRPWRGYA